MNDQNSENSRPSPTGEATRFDTLKAVREAGLVAESQVGEQQWVLPGTPPAGWLGEEPCWPKGALETLRTRKAWKRQGRRLAPGAEPVRRVEREGSALALFAYAQTLDEAAWLETQRERLTRQALQWGADLARLEGELTAWAAALTPGTGDPVEIQEAFTALHRRGQALLERHHALAQPAAKLTLPLGEMSPGPWEDALERFRDWRFSGLLRELKGHDPEERELAARVDGQLRQEEAGSGASLPLAPYWKYYGRFFKALEGARIQRDVADATRIHEFHALFPARHMRRHFTLYLGPTNSGKTYQALQRLSRAARGCYLAPLRLLALEVAETLQEWGVRCSMITGEERIIDPLAEHTASTIEMLSLGTRYDLCVIDEAQMLGDVDRGWAWTQAILGVQADEVCVVGAPEARPAIEKLLALTGDPFEVVELERLTPLELMHHPVTHFEQLEPGTAVIAFSRAGVLGLKQEMEHHTGQRVAVLYGALPPEVRREQARQFASGEAPLLAATDAIGMGLNLPIRTILFAQDRKLINREEHPLTPMEVRQIGGRAGRFGKNEMGHIGTFRLPLAHIKLALETPPHPIRRAHLAPNLEHMQALSRLHEERHPQLSRLFGLFTRLVKPDPAIYRLSDLDDQTVLAHIADRYKGLPLETRFALSAAPVPLRVGLAVSAFERMVEAVAKGRELLLEDLLPGELSADPPPLGVLESAMQVVNLYCWLHYRFIDTFPQLAEAEAARRDINRRINAILGRKRKPGRYCTSCDTLLPKEHEHPICDTCFLSRRRKGGGPPRGSRGRPGGRPGGRRGPARGQRRRG